MSNPKAQSKLPPVAAAAKQLKKKSRGCARCQKRKKQTAVASALRDQIMGWPDELKSKLKGVLKADKIRFYTSASKGKKPKLVEF